MEHEEQRSCKCRLYTGDYLGSRHRQQRAPNSGKRLRRSVSLDIKFRELAPVSARNRTTPPECREMIRMILKPDKLDKHQNNGNVVLR